MSLVRFVPLALLFVLLQSCERDSERQNAAIVERIEWPDLSSHDEAIRTRIAALHEQLDPAKVNARPEVIARAYGELGRNYHAHRLYRVAAACYQNASTLHDRQFEWAYLRGCALLSVGESAEALTWFRTSLELSPTSIPALLRVAELEQARGQTDEALLLLRRVIARRKGGLARAHFVLGKVHSRRGDYELAIESFETCLRLAPLANSVYYPLAMAKRKAGDREGAENMLTFVGPGTVEIPDPWMDAVRQLEAGAHAKQNRGLKLIRGGSTREGLDQLRLATIAEPDDPILFVTYGSELAQQRRLPEARSALERALEIDADNHHAHLSMGRLSALEGKWQEAVRHTRRAVESAPSSQKAVHNLALLLEQVGDVDGAIEAYARLVELDPGRRAPRFEQVSLLVRHERWSAAARCLERATEDLPDATTLLIKRARILASCPVDEVRDGREALALVRRAAPDAPGPELLRVMAMAHAELGDFVEAIRAVEKGLEVANSPDQREVLMRDLEVYRRREPLRSD